MTNVSFFPRSLPTNTIIRQTLPFYLCDPASVFTPPPHPPTPRNTQFVRFSSAERFIRYCVFIALNCNLRSVSSIREFVGQIKIVHKKIIFIPYSGIRIRIKYSNTRTAQKRILIFHRQKKKIYFRSFFFHLIEK